MATLYMKYDGIDGDATHKGHEKWIELSSFQVGIGRGITGGTTGGGANREASAPSISEITVTKTMDASSNALYQEALYGAKGKKVTFHFVTTDNPPKVIKEVKLEEALISSFSTSSGGDRPTEALSLNFTKFEIVCTPTGVDATDKAPKRVFYDVAKAYGG